MIKTELESIESRRDSKSSRSSSVILDTLQSLNRELVEESIMNAIKSLQRLENEQIDDQLLIELFYAASEKFSQACEMLDQLREKVLIVKAANSNRRSVPCNQRICRAHNVELNQVFNLKGLLEKELKSIEGVDDKIQEIEDKISITEEKYTKKHRISKERHKFATKLDKKIEEELKPLKLELAKFKTDITKVGETRFEDQVCFTTEINPGSGFKPLNKSGGELSRFLLGLSLFFG